MYDTIYISITVSGVRVYAAQLVEHRLHSGNGHAPGTRFGLRFEYCIIQRNSYFWICFELMTRTKENGLHYKDKEDEEEYSRLGSFHQIHRISESVETKE